MRLDNDIFGRPLCCVKKCRQPTIPRRALCRLHYLRQSWINIQAAAKRDPASRKPVLVTFDQAISQEVIDE